MKTIVLPLDHEPSYEDNSTYGKLSLLYSTLTRLTDATMRTIGIGAVSISITNTIAAFSLIFVNTIDLQRATE